ncbi:hypothetical protein MMC21_004346 [Puttea exsequens]|nr:hypothetical protein [Puttea exsequens]
MSTLSYGLNITKKPPIGQRPAPAKRKPIFDDDSDPEDGPVNVESAKAVTNLGGLQQLTSKPKSSRSTAVPPTRPSQSPKASHYSSISAKLSASQHSTSASELDPNIYDYDAVYDSLHAKPTSSSSNAQADVEKKPKYMKNLIAAAEVRKRDQLRAKEKMLAKEREAEGDEFADKEKFVTKAYKRQQEEVRRAEEEEAVKEREAEERKRKEGGGMGALYKDMLARTEEKHKEVMKAVEEGRGKDQELGGEPQKEKSEAELAKAKGATVNEEGEIVDKRQLLSAGLNTGAAPKARPKAERRDGGGRRSGKESSRDRETWLFEEQMLGKRSASDDSYNDDERAAKSRKMEDELLGLGTP